MKQNVGGYEEQGSQSIPTDSIIYARHISITRFHTSSLKILESIMAVPECMENEIRKWGGMRSLSLS